MLVSTQPWRRNCVLRVEISTGYPNTQGRWRDWCSYRPISLLSIPSKILESVVNDALVTHVFASNNLASDRQLAFRKGFSTELLLTQLTELWRKEVDKGNAVAVAFIDFKKAFDCVQHEQLLTKLQKNFGILGPLHNWLKSYLSNWPQYTVVNGVKSKMQSVSVGIPQRSVLGPTLFALYTSDLPSSVPTCSTMIQRNIVWLKMGTKQYSN